MPFSYIVSFSRIFVLLLRCFMHLYRSFLSLLLIHSFFRRKKRDSNDYLYADLIAIQSIFPMTSKILHNLRNRNFHWPFDSAKRKSL